MTPERNSASHDADGSSADNPLADFDELAYLECNPDVRTAVLQGAVSSGQQHWLEHGRAEGRVFAKSALDASLFPPQWDELRYLRQNPDVAGAVRAGTFSSGYDHWMKHGANEARTGGDTVFQKAPIGAVLSQNTPGVNYFGFHSTAIGLGSVARAYAHLLRELSPNLTAIDVPWDLPAAGTVAEVAAESLYAANVIHLNPDVLPIFLHRYGAKLLVNRYNIGYWVWELHAGYPAWHRYTRMFHEIWVPSEFVASAMRPVSAAPVTTVRYVVDGFPAAASTSRDEFGFPHDAFVFLYVFDAASRILRIGASKFSPPRQLPLSVSTVAALQTYSQLRQQKLLQASPPAFFLIDHAHALTRDWAEEVFAQLRAQLGWTQPPVPRLHDFRHSLAVKCLVAWNRQPGGVGAKILALSAYLGHRRVTDTYWYLTAIPQLLAASSARFERLATSTPEEPRHG